MAWKRSASINFKQLHYTYYWWPQFFSEWKYLVEKLFHRFYALGTNLRMLAISNCNCSNIYICRLDDCIIGFIITNLHWHDNAMHRHNKIGKVGVHKHIRRLNTGGTYKHSYIANTDIFSQLQGYWPIVYLEFSCQLVVITCTIIEVRLAK